MKMDFEIIKNTPAPARSRACPSAWRNFFQGLEVGNWFTIPEAAHSRISASASQYCKGCYSMYKTTSYPGVHIFVLTSDAFKPFNTRKKTVA